jgi:hypothetical protein
MAGGSLDPRSRAACALRVSRREMLGERQVAAPLMAQRAAHGAVRPAHRRFQPGQGVGVQLAGLRLSGQPQRPSQRQFGHETLVLGFALIAPAASRPGQHCAVRWQCGRQVAPCGHSSTVGQRFVRLVLRDEQQERRPEPCWKTVRLAETHTDAGRGRDRGNQERASLCHGQAAGDGAAPAGGSVAPAAGTARARPEPEMPASAWTCWTPCTSRRRRGTPAAPERTRADSAGPAPNREV